MTAGDRLPGTWLRRIAERSFDPETVDKVILPALADLQHETSTAGGGAGRRYLTLLRSYWGVWKTLAVCSIGDVAQNRDRITSSLGVRTGALLLLMLVLLMVPWIQWMIGFGAKYGAGSALAAGVWLLPSNFLVALPMAFFLALAIFPVSDGLPSSRLAPSAAAGTLACVAVVATLLMTVAPATNQAFRTQVFTTLQPDVSNGPRMPLRKGVTEMTLPELNAHIRQAPSRRQAELASAHRQERFAFVGAVFVLGLLGLALAGRWRSRLATLGVALAVIAVYVVPIGYKSGYPAAYGTWTADGVFLIIGVLLLRSRRDAIAISV